MEQKSVWSGIGSNSHAALEGLYVHFSWRQQPVPQAHANALRAWVWLQPKGLVFTHEELAKYGADQQDSENPVLYLAVLGQVFDVSSKPKYYGKY